MELVVYFSAYLARRGMCKVKWGVDKPANNEITQYNTEEPTEVHLNENVFGAPGSRMQGI